MMNLLFVVLIFYVTVCGGVNALQGDFCGKCSPISGVKCIDETTFAFCDKRGKATNRIAVCPGGFKCVNNVNICTPEDRGECVPKCGECRNGRFACMSPTTFSLCFGGNQTSKVQAKCPLGTLCSTAKFDLTSKNPVLDFCFSEIQLEHSEIDCFKYEAPVYIPPPRPVTRPTPIRPTPAQPGRLPLEKPVEVPEQDPNVFCRSQRIGKYQILSDKKCQKYYFCYHNGHYMVGKILTCAEHSVFNPTAQKCVRSSLGFYLLHQCGEFNPINQTLPRNEYNSWSYISPINTMSPVDYKHAVNEMKRIGYTDEYGGANSESESGSQSHLELAQPMHPIIRMNPSLNKRYPANYIGQTKYMNSLPLPPLPGSYLSPLGQTRPEAFTETNSYLNAEGYMNPGGHVDTQSYLDPSDYLTPRAYSTPNKHGKALNRESMSMGVSSHHFSRLVDTKPQMESTYQQVPIDHQVEPAQPTGWIDNVDPMDKWEQMSPVDISTKPMNNIDVIANAGTQKTWNWYY